MLKYTLIHLIEEYKKQNRVFKPNFRITLLEQFLQVSGIKANEDVSFAAFNRYCLRQNIPNAHLIFTECYLGKKDRSAQLFGKFIQEDQQKLLEEKETNSLDFLDLQADALSALIFQRMLTPNRVKDFNFHAEKPKADGSDYPTFNHTLSFAQAIIYLHQFNMLNPKTFDRAHTLANLYLHALYKEKVLTARIFMIFYQQKTSSMSVSLTRGFIGLKEHHRYEDENAIKQLMKNPKEAVATSHKLQETYSPRLAFVMGLHPRLGKSSSLGIFAKSAIGEQNTLKMIFALAGLGEFAFDKETAVMFTEPKVATVNKI